MRRCRAAADALAELAGQSFGVDAARWREWWDRHKDLSNEQWLEMRLACQTSRVRRLEGDLKRARMQVLRLQQQVYGRLTPADRPTYIQMALEQDDPMVRAWPATGRWNCCPTRTPLSKRSWCRCCSG